MCGIAGIVSAAAGTHAAPPTDPEILRAMTKALAHRGPDAEGYYEDAGVALGHRRLKVIDLEGGAQPMSSGDGEIYNHEMLRHELEALGHRFRSRSDIEVLVHGYVEWGPAKLLDRIEGMFAFGLWDARTKRLLLARDRTGQTPLFTWPVAVLSPSVRALK